MPMPVLSCSSSTVRCGVEPCPGLMTFSLFLSASGEGEQVGHRPDRRRGVHQEHVGRGAELGDRQEVLECVVARLAIEADVDHEAGRGDQQRVAVRRRFADLHHADIPARARPVDDQHRLAEPRAEAWLDHARHDVGGTARRRRDDELHRSLGIAILRPRRNGHRGKRRGQHGAAGQAVRHTHFLRNSFTAGIVERTSRIPPVPPALPFRTASETRRAAGVPRPQRAVCRHGYARTVDHRQRPRTGPRPAAFARRPWRGNGPPPRGDAGGGRRAGRRPTCFACCCPGASAARRSPCSTTPGRRGAGLCRCQRRLVHQPVQRLLRDLGRRHAGRDGALDVRHAGVGLAWGARHGRSKAIKRRGRLPAERHLELRAAAAGTRPGSAPTAPCRIPTARRTMRYGKPDDRSFVFRRKRGDDHRRLAGARPARHRQRHLHGRGPVRPRRACARARRAAGAARDTARSTPLMSTLLYATGFCSVTLGVARRLLDSYVDLARGKHSRASPNAMAANNAVQREIGQLEARLSAARAFLHEAACEAYDAAAAGKLDARPPHAAAPRDHLRHERGDRRVHRLLPRRRHHRDPGFRALRAPLPRRHERQPASAGDAAAMSRWSAATSSASTIRCSIFDSVKFMIARRSA